MKFRLDFDVPKFPFDIGHRDKLFLIGSCFTENIGQKFLNYKFNVLQNPHGVLFNPLSVATSIRDCVHQKNYGEADLFELNEGFHSWHHHSRYSDITSAGSLEKINTSICESHQFLQQTNYAIITLGSAWVYENHQEKYPSPFAVANNHKAPADWFRRRLLSPAEVIKCLNDICDDLMAMNDSMKIIFTISPVRHIREGLIDNNRSKAVLIQSVHEVKNTRTDSYYFPSYELVIDDLRDYRYYSEDLVHPNYFATEYVWEKLLDACISESSREILKALTEIRRAFTHKPFNVNSAQHLAFRKKYAAKVDELQKKYPFLDLSEEVHFFSSRD